MRNTYKGKFVPKNPHKYRGDINNIIFRSSWELKLMKFLDEHSGVLEYGSEEIVIPYKSPVDGQFHRYFVDFFIKIKTKTGEIKRYLIEVKPFRFTQEPTIPKRKTKQFINEVYQWAVNNAKWDAAKKVAKQNGWEFMLITEKDLGLLQN